MRATSQLKGRSIGERSIGVLPGQYFDAETGTNYNYFRDYDPAVGRYVESDPVGLQGSLNTYAYVGANPIAYSDRRGLDPWGSDPGQDWSTKPGVPPPTGPLWNFTVCLRLCLGGSFTVTSTWEATPQHLSGTPHANGVALDIRFANPQRALCCAKQCGAKFGLNEYANPSPNATGGHVHMQLPPGTRGGSGDLPKSGCEPCDVSKSCCAY